MVGHWIRVSLGFGMTRYNKRITSKILQNGTHSGLPVGSSFLLYPNCIKLVHGYGQLYAEACYQLCSASNLFNSEATAIGF